MGLSRTSKGAVATAAALVGLLAPAAGASTSSAATATQAVSSGTFAVVPTLLATGTPPPGAQALAFTPATTQQYLWVANTGSLDLVAASYAATLTYVGTGTPTITLRSCPGASWNTTSHTCSTTPVVVGAWQVGGADPVASPEVPAAPGSRLHLQAQVTVSALGVMVSAAATIDVSVSSGPVRQVRAARTGQA